MRTIHDVWAALQPPPLGDERLGVVGFIRFIPAGKCGCDKTTAGAKERGPRVLSLPAGTGVLSHSVSTMKIEIDGTSAA